MKVTIIPVFIGSFGALTKGILKALEDLEIRKSSTDHPNYYIIENGQNTGRVLESWDEQSLKLQWNSISERWCEKINNNNTNNDIFILRTLSLKGNHVIYTVLQIWFFKMIDTSNISHNPLDKNHIPLLISTFGADTFLVPSRHLIAKSAIVLWSGHLLTVRSQGFQVVGKRIGYFRLNRKWNYFRFSKEEKKNRHTYYPLFVIRITYICTAGSHKINNGRHRVK